MQGHQLESRICLILPQPDPAKARRPRSLRCLNGGHSIGILFLCTFAFLAALLTNLIWTDYKRTPNSLVSSPATKLAPGS